MTAKQSSSSPRAPARTTLGETSGTDLVGRFEADLAELERIVQQMESGDLTLEKSLQLFERGVQLGKQCRASLEKAELRVHELAPELDMPPAAPRDVADGALSADDTEIPF